MSCRIVTIAAGATLVLLTPFSMTVAFASSTGGDGGNSAGGSDGGSTVTVTVSGSSGTPGSTSTSSSTGSGASGSSRRSCVYTPVSSAESQELGPGGPTPGAWYEVKCPAEQMGYDTVTLVWIQTAKSSSPPVTIDPLTLAMQAENSLHLPNPSIDLNPAAFSVVELPTWMWVSPALWHPYVASASASGVSATATAIPTSVTWNMGDGSTVTCAGPGTPYQATESPSQQTDCSYTYTESSAGQPSPDGEPNDGSFSITATVNWAVSWQATGIEDGGTLPALTTTASGNVRVEQIESLMTD